MHATGPEYKVGSLHTYRANETCYTFIGLHLHRVCTGPKGSWFTLSLHASFALAVSWINYASNEAYKELLYTGWKKVADCKRVNEDSFISGSEALKIITFNIV